jgi:myo-inositol 2-dehydrogenase / D-chiro-inositol 1-dehydrogenase
VLGAGRIGQLHAKLLAEQPGIDVIVWDVDFERARRAAEAIHGSGAPSLDEAIRDADAAVIAASTNAHDELVRATVERDLPTFCEKPLAFDLPETVELVELIDKRGVVVQVGFQRRFDPAYREARRLVESGALGSLYLVRLIAHDHEPPPDEYIPISGGLFRDSAIHDFDALRWLTGQEVHEVYAAGSVRGFPIFARYDDIDTGAAILRLADGTLGVLSQTRHNPLGYDVRMEVVGSRDAVAVGLGARTPLRPLDADGPRFTTPGWDGFLTRFATAYRDELIEFIRVAGGETPSPCTPKDALAAMRIAIAAGRSRVENRPIRLADI